MVNTALYDLLLNSLPDHRNLKSVLREGMDPAEGDIVKPQRVSAGIEETLSVELKMKETSGHQVFLTLDLMTER